MIENLTGLTKQLRDEKLNRDEISKQSEDEKLTPGEEEKLTVLENWILYLNKENPLFEEQYLQRFMSVARDRFILVDTDEALRGISVNELGTAVALFAAFQNPQHPHSMDPKQAHKAIAEIYLAARRIARVRMWPKYELLADNLEWVLSQMEMANPELKISAINRGLSAVLCAITSIHAGYQRMAGSSQTPISQQKGISAFDCRVLDTQPSSDQ